MKVGTSRVTRPWAAVLTGQPPAPRPAPRSSPPGLEARPWRAAKTRTSFAFGPGPRNGNQVPFFDRPSTRPVARPPGPWPEHSANGQPARPDDPEGWPPHPAGRSLRVPPRTPAPPERFQIHTPGPALPAIVRGQTRFEKYRRRWCSQCFGNTGLEVLQSPRFHQPLVVKERGRRRFKTPPRQLARPVPEHGPVPGPDAEPFREPSGPPHRHPPPPGPAGRSARLPPLAHPLRPGCVGPPPPRRIEIHDHPSPQRIHRAVAPHDEPVAGKRRQQSFQAL